MRKLIAVLAVALLGLAVVAPVTAAALVAEPAPAYGLCVNKNTGLTRALERNNLASSRNGKCRTTERKITVPSVTGLAPSKLVFRWPAETWTCPRASATASTWTFTCTSVPIPVPSPSPTPSVTATP